MLECEREEVRNVHTLARWRFSEDYGIPSGISWLRLRFLLSLMWDALSQTVLHDGRHGSRKAKGTDVMKGATTDPLFIFIT